MYSKNSRARKDVEISWARSNLLRNNKTYVLTDENKLFYKDTPCCNADPWTWFVVVHKQLSDPCIFTFHLKPHNNSTSDESFNTNKEDSF